MFSLPFSLVSIINLAWKKNTTETMLYLHFNLTNNKITCVTWLPIVAELCKIISLTLTKNIWSKYIFGWVRVCGCDVTYVLPPCFSHSLYLSESPVVETAASSVRWCPARNTISSTHRWSSDSSGLSSAGASSGENFYGQKVVLLQAAAAVV